MEFKNLRIKELKLTLLCIIIGVFSGLSAVIFRWMVQSFHNLMWKEVKQWFSFTGRISNLIIPIIGLLIVSTFIRYTLERNNQKHGVTEVIRVLNKRDGKIPYYIAPVEAIASSLCIGSGGSVGPEGPMVQIGAGVGSSIGQIFKISSDELKLLAAAGASGGLSAIFNAPLAGIFFAMEALVKKLHCKIFFYFALSSITATQIYRLFYGNKHLLNITEAFWGSWQELFIFLMLGIFGGIIVTVFIFSVNTAESKLKGLAFHSVLSPMAGGAILGLFALYLPHVLGEGYETIATTLKNNIPMEIILLIIILKIFATSITLGTGGSGGVFAPSLVLGALLGSGISNFAANFFSNIMGSHETYIAAGITAVLSSVFSAPITAVIMVIELANNYEIALPLMVASVSASYINNLFFKECSIYEIDLVKNGIRDKETEYFFRKSSVS
ncbi:MAG: chloride channel protein [Clostridia bacterium]|nr:chloride channel protein [Clostridia bacterium]